MDKTAKWILRWLIVGIFFVSAENSKCQESPTNSIQQTNQTNTYKAPAAFPPDCQAYDQKLISKITHQVNDLIYKTNNIFLDPQKKS